MKHVTLRGIVVAGESRAEAESHYRAVATGASTIALRSEADGFMLLSNAGSGLTLLNPLKGVGDLVPVSSDVVAKFEFLSSSGSEDKTVKAFYTVCTDGCDSHIIADDAELMKHCPACASELKDLTDEEILAHVNKVATPETTPTTEIMAVASTKEAAISEFRKLVLNDTGRAAYNCGHHVVVANADSTFKFSPYTSDAVANADVPQELKVEASAETGMCDAHMYSCASTDCGTHVVSSSDLPVFCPVCASGLIEPDEDEEEDEDMSDEEYEDDESEEDSEASAATIKNSATASDDEEEDDEDSEDEESDDEEDDEDSEEDESDETSEDDEDEESEEEEESDEDEESEEDEDDLDDDNSLSISSSDESNIKVTKPIVNAGAAPTTPGTTADAVAATATATPEANATVDAAAEAAAAAALAGTAETNTDAKPEGEQAAAVANTEGTGTENSPTAGADTGAATGDNGDAAATANAEQGAGAPAATVVEKIVEKIVEVPTAQVAIATDLLAIASTGTELVHTDLFVSFASSINGEDKWVAFYKDLPVAIASGKETAHKDIFTTPAFANVVLASAQESGVAAALSQFGFKAIATKIDVDTYVQDTIAEQVEAQVATASAGLNTFRQDFITRFEAALATAATGINTNFFKDATNPVKDALVQTFATCGVKNSETLVNTAFASGNPEYLRSLVAKANNIMDYDVEVQNQLTEAVASASQASGIMPIGKPAPVLRQEPVQQRMEVTASAHQNVPHQPADLDVGAVLATLGKKTRY